MASGQAYVTLATNDSYGLGALVLGTSLRNTGTTRKLVILITPEVSSSMRNQLNKIFDVVEVVDVLDSKDSANLTLLSRPELGVTLTKLHAWNLTQFSKAVFLDADALVLSNVDELFDRDELSAVPDVGWPDCFNTGVFVFRPSADTYSSLLKFAQDTGSFDGGDQGLLNAFFSSWATADIKTHLSFIYNMVATAIYSYAPAFKQYGSNVKIVHFLGNTKPWHHTSGVAGGFSPALGNYLTLWWNIFNRQVRTSLEPGLVGLAGRIGQMDLGSNYEQRISSGQQGGARESQRRDWESGNIDYMGSDRFENIQKRIQESIHKSEVGQPSRKSPPPAARPVEDVPTLMEKATDAVSHAAEPVIQAATSAVHAASAASDAVTSAVGAGIVHAVEGAASLGHAAVDMGHAVVDKVSGLFHATPDADEKKLQSEASRPSPPPGAPGSQTGAPATGHVVSSVTIEPTRPVQPVQPIQQQSHSQGTRQSPGPAGHVQESRVETVQSSRQSPGPAQAGGHASVESHSTTRHSPGPAQAGGHASVESHVTTQSTRQSPPVQGAGQISVESHTTRQNAPAQSGGQVSVESHTTTQTTRQSPPVQGAPAGPQGARQTTPPVAGVPPQQQQPAPKK